MKPVTSCIWPTVSGIWSRKQRLGWKRKALLRGYADRVGFAVATCISSQGG